jgi:Terminase large subunit, T4likevirus-type, N-terminal
MSANLASQLTHAVDPVEFARACGVTPDPWQADLLRSDARRALLLCSRQSGKSTVCALAGLHTALYSAGLVVIASPSMRQSAEMLRSIKGFYANLKDAPTLTHESVLKVEFANGGRILALPGDERTIRGIGGVSLVILDEASRIDDELVTATRPMLATRNGRMIALTTPAGRRGFFYDAWHSTTQDWHKIRVSAANCPRISKEFLAEEMKILGPTKFSEEYNLEFIDSNSSAFLSILIEQALTDDFDRF